MKDHVDGKPEAIVERFYYQGWNKGDHQVLTDILDPNVRFRGSFRRKPIGGVQGFLQYMDTAQKAVGGNRIEILQIVQDSIKGTVALKLLNHGVHKGSFFGVPGSGHEISWHSAAFFTLSRDGSRIVDIWVLGDVDGLKNQIGANSDAEGF